MNNENEITNLLQTDSSKLFTWLSKNPEIVSAAIEKDTSLTAEGKQALLRELHLPALVEKENSSVLPVTNHNKKATNDSPPRKNSSRGQGELKKSTQNLNLNLTNVHLKPYIPRKPGKLEETEFGGSSERSNSSLSERSNSSLSDRSSPQNSPTPDRNNSQNSPKRLHKASLSSSISGLGRSIFSSSDSSRTIQVHNNNSGLLPEFKLNKPVYKIPVNATTQKQYIDNATKESKTQPPASKSR